jgi:hypothetical protein
MVKAMQVWLSRVLPKCIFLLWLALRDMCWMTDRLEHRGLPRPTACPFCDHVQESIAHLPLGCVFVRMVWATCLRWWNKVDHVPTTDIGFAEWLQSWRGRRVDLRGY